MRSQTARQEPRPDLVMTIADGGPKRLLFAEIKSTGQPRVAREACLALLEATRLNPKAYPVFVAPYISPKSASICQSYNVGYIDFAGNCRLAFDRIYIRCEGYPNPQVRARELRSLYSAKAERVLRVLLAAGNRIWRTQELADEAQVSLGQVANVKKLLADREWITTEPAGFALRSFEGAVSPLLEEWTVNYRYSRNSFLDFYSLKTSPQVEADLIAAARKQRIRLGLTVFSGAARLAPTVRYQRTSAYVVGDIQALANQVGLKQVTSGANVTLIAPYDEGVLYGLREIDGSPVVSSVQLYLDLMQTKGRGEEAATAILQQIIRPLWQ